jgi:hypothetical protein
MEIVVRIVPLFEIGHDLLLPNPYLLILHDHILFPLNAMWILQLKQRR